MIFDTHAHYDDKAFEEDREELLDLMHKNGVINIVNVAAGMDSCITTMELAAKHDFIYAAVGVHPNETQLLTEEDMLLLEKYCDEENVVAVGEIGLDYYWNDPEPEHQKKFFRRQIDIARRKKLPMIIHSRDAAADTMNIMKEEHCEDIGGVIHCYSYSLDHAREYVDMGFYIGVGGVVTFKNGRKLKECVEAIPLSKIVIETDSPYLSPEPNRGKRNNSLNLTHVVNTIANIKNIEPKEVYETTYNNALKLYRL